MARRTKPDVKVLVDALQAAGLKLCEHEDYDGRVLNAGPGDALYFWNIQEGV